LSGNYVLHFHYEGNLEVVPGTCKASGYRLMIKNTLLSLFSLLLSLLLVETMLGFFKSHTISRESDNSWYSYQFVDRKGNSLSLKEGDVKLSYHPAYEYDNLPDQIHDRFSVDSQGNRHNTSDLFTHARFDRIILVSGGSTAFGTGLPSNEDTFTAHLEHQLSATSVINHAVIGYHGVQELLKAYLQGVYLKPILTISLSGWNDFKQISYVEDVTNYDPFMALTQVETRLSGIKDLEGKSLAGRVYYFITNVMFKNVRQSVSQLFSSPSNEKKLISVDKVADSYARVMKKYQLTMNMYNSNFLVVLQPDFHSFNNSSETVSWQGKMYDEFRLLAKRKMDELHVPYVDLNDFQNRFDKDMFMDTIHLNSQGNKVMADLVMENLPDHILALLIEDEKE
jgi:hypothetical protein